jgi:hypothetical protein
MKNLRKTSSSATTVSLRMGTVAAFIFLLGAILPAPALAGFEQVATFGEGGPDTQTNRIVVNATGAGGVPAGTVYMTANEGETAGVYRYSAKGESLGRWLTMVSVTGLAIDQSTGYVYVSGPIGFGEEPTVRVYSADGSKLITTFGEYDGEGSFEESPEKFHRPGSVIAVDDSGTVYASDFGPGQEHRTMVWKPQSPGDYEHYVYAGPASDLDLSGPVFLDDAGNLYNSTSEEIREFAPGQPGELVSICKYEFPVPVEGGGGAAMTVNPVTGEVFYTLDAKSIHQLSACDEAGKFEEAGTFTLTPKPVGQIRALGINPILSWDASRPPGVLYAADNNFRGFNYILAPTEVLPPAIESQSALSVTSTTANLTAQIDPKGSAVGYVFQYETAAEFEANPPSERFESAAEAPAGGTTLPATQGVQGAGASLVGLEPDTTYRFRVIATSHCESDHPKNTCEGTGEAKAFHTFPEEVSGLPDHRVWELVSPAKKSGGEVFPLEPDVGSGAACRRAAGCKPGVSTVKLPRQSAPDGDAVAYAGFPFSTTEGAAVLNEYVSRRTASGWQTTILAPALSSSPGAGSDSGYNYAALDPSLGQGVLHQDSPSLTPDAPFEYPNLYRQPTSSPSTLSPLVASEPPNRSATGLNEFKLSYAGASKDLSHVFFKANDALTGETPFAPEAVDLGAELAQQTNLYEWIKGQLRLVNVLPGNTESVPGNVGAAITGSDSDLSRAISADGSRVFWSDEAGQAYVRINGEATVAIPDPGEYLTASDDGSEVLLSNGHLYDLETETTTDLTEGKGGFQGVAGQSEDLSHIYFVDTAALTGEEKNDQGDKAQAEQPNLYSWSKGGSSFVATLAAGEQKTWLGFPAPRTAEASPDGRWLAFQSTVPLTGYDNAGPTCSGNSAGQYAAGACAEAFLYDSATGELLCASCNPSGARPLGGTRLPIVETFAETYISQPRYLLDSGRLYFDSQDALSPFDTNRAVDGPTEGGKPSGAGAAGAEDVYQYEPEGIGACEREGGCLNLISAGHEALDSNFLAVDGTGANVFFTTRDQLALKDTDELMDLYDAREGGGISSATETARGECQGEACQPQVSPPNDPTPGSSSFEGAGNVVEEAKVRKHRKHRHKHKAKKHRHVRTAKHSRGGAK